MKLKFVLPFLVTVFVIIVFHFTNIFAVKFYPVLANFSVFLLFFISYFQKETVIQKIAKSIEGELDDYTKKYTKNLTLCWAIFTFFNFMISLFTVFLPEKIWAIYNGFVSYILIGSFFAIEYVVRIILREKYQK